MKQLVIFCVLLASCFANPIIPNYREDIKVELKNDADTVNALNNTDIIIIHNGKINLEENSNNNSSGKILLLDAILQRFPTPSPGTAGGVNNYFFSPLAGLLNKLRPTTAATTTSTESTTTTTTTPTTTTTTTPTTTTTTTPTTTTTTTPTTTTTTTPTTTTTTTVMPG